MKELYSNGFASSIAQAIEEMKVEQGDGFSLDRINLAELERRSGVSRGKLRRLKRNGFQNLPRSSKGRKHAATKLSGYTGIIDSLLRQGTKNSSVISCLRGKKTDFLLQEVFARLILYNYASLIARKIPVPQEKQINFSTAILVCKQFLKGKIRPAQIFEILSKHLSPIRPGRQYKRYQNPVSAVAFQYRFS